MAIQKKEKWTEEEVAALPAGEQDYFERKSGAVLSSPNFDDVLAKALCAIANLRGGYLILGVADDGTIDGVPAIRKGRQSTKDWLEQIITYSLNYPLQDFRVHEVVPSTPSAIPAGQVVIVIDVGDSALAPHQTAKSKTYFYRAGGRSEPAPHFYLDTLWGRQSFPSAKVARTWLDRVIRPALSALANEREMVERGRWSWEVARNSIPGAYPFQPPYRFTNANDEQFLEFYPEIRDLLRSHDEALSNLERALKDLPDWLLGGAGFEAVYDKATSPGSLAALRDLSPPEAGKFGTDTELGTALFGHPARERHYQIIADLLINATEPAADRKLLSQFWKQHGRFFTSTVSQFATYKQLLPQAEARFAEFSSVVERLHGALTEKRRDLATRHGEPYESSA
jgi:hypothetical protein